MIKDELILKYGVCCWECKATKEELDQYKKEKEYEDKIRAKRKLIIR